MRYLCEVRFNLSFVSLVATWIKNVPKGGGYDENARFIYAHWELQVKTAPNSVNADTKTVGDKKLRYLYNCDPLSIIIKNAVSSDPI